MQCEPLHAEEVETHYHQALALAEELGMRPLQAHCHRGLGTFYAKIGSPRAGSRCPVHRHRPVSRHGHDVLAPPCRGSAGPGRGAVMDSNAIRAICSLHFANMDHYSGLIHKRMPYTPPPIDSSLTRRRLLQSTLGGAAGLVAWHQGWPRLQSAAAQRLPRSSAWTHGPRAPTGCTLPLYRNAIRIRLTPIFLRSTSVPRSS